MPHDWKSLGINYFGIKEYVCERCGIFADSRTELPTPDKLGGTNRDKTCEQLVLEPIHAS
jgi:hypothetical protein